MIEFTVMSAEVALTEAWDEGYKYASKEYVSVRTAKVLHEMQDKIDAYEEFMYELEDKIQMQYNELNRLENRACWRDYDGGFGSWHRGATKTLDTLNRFVEWCKP